MTFKKSFPFLTWPLLIKTPKILHFSDKQCPFTQNFAKQPNIFSRDSDLTTTFVRPCVRTYVRASVIKTP